MTASRVLLSAALLSVLALAPPAHAVTLFTAELSNAAETSPVVPTLTNGDPRPASFGSASFELNDAQTALTFTATVSNIDFTGTQSADTNDNLSVAHLHGGPAVTPTTNGPVVWGFIGSPFNDTNMDLVITPFATGVGATIFAKWDAPEGNNTTLTEQLPNLLEGRVYINFHTVQFPGGEVRGNLAIIPEPAPALLLGLGLAALPAWRRGGRGRT